jgi:hypothetical protein
MSTPRISICVPNLNTRPFLPERFETIFNQTIQDWELLVYDSYSNDGAWEYISELATREPRIRAWQGPREGTPGSWTPCVRQAAGEFVYVATSDDTMAPDCLEKMLDALDAHPECGLAHCRLRPIDEHGRDALDDWWPKHSSFARSSGRLIDQPHIRRAPFDGLLHLLRCTVYTSITQLLIRRSLFDQVGYFPSRWGSVGDFNWCMRAGLVANTVHVPDTWGGWRVHPAQATAGARLSSPEHARKQDEMVQDAIDGCLRHLPPVIKERLIQRWQPDALEWTMLSGRRRQKDPLRRKGYLTRRLLAGSRPAWSYVAGRLLGRPVPDTVEVIRGWLEEAGIDPVLAPISESPIIARHTPGRCDSPAVTHSNKVTVHSSPE